MQRAIVSNGFRVCVLLVACAPLAAYAQVYRCTAPDGSVAYQDHACAHRQEQQVINLPSRAPPDYEPPPAATVAAPATPAQSDLLPAPLPSPLPVMYACVGAVNGRHYLAHSPPAPYLAPLGVMGYPPQSLGEVYGAPGGAGMSAPESSRPRVVGPSIAAGMTPVQDRCRPASHAEVCGLVQDEYANTQRKLRMAMRHERAPLERRERRLTDQLRNCR